MRSLTKDEDKNILSITHYPYISINRGADDPWLLHRKEELDHDRYHQRSESQRSPVQPG